MSFEESCHIPTDESCLRLANYLIQQCSLSISEFDCLAQINSNFIVSLFEAITRSTVPDLLACADKVEEAHNVQAVIDTLSLDLLGISLSHITGEAIVAGDRIAIFNLMQILEGLIKCSSDQNSQRIIKRKISRIKKRKSKSFKENIVIKDSKISFRNIKKSISSTSSSSSPNIMSSINSKCKNVQPAFSQVSFKAKNRQKANKKLSLKSSLKESILLSPCTAYKTFTESNLTSEDIPVNKTASNSKANFDALDSVTSKITPLLSDESILTEKCIQPSNIFHRKNSSKEELLISPKIQKRKVCKLSHHKKLEVSSMNESVEKLYERNFESKLKALIQKSSSCKSRLSRVKNSHFKVMTKPLKKSPILPCHKSFLLPYNLRRKSHSLNQIYTEKEQPKEKTSPQVKAVTDLKLPDKGFIQELLDEFPGIQLSPTLMSYIKTKYEQQCLKMHKQLKTCLLQKPKTIIQAEAVSEKQLKIAYLLKKDILEQQYLNDVKDQKNNENKMKYRLRDSRLKSIKMKQYCNEFHEEMRKKMKKRNIAEELIIEQVFREAMNIQNDQVNYLCDQVKETREEDAKQYLNYLVSLENLYQTQFSMISEAFSNQKKDAKLKIDAEKQELDKMQREFQDILKKEIRFMQKTIVDQTEDYHFRELDAQQFIERMRKQFA